MLGIQVILSVNVINHVILVCEKSCDFDDYLDYEKRKCRKRLTGKLVEECNENIDEAKLTEIALLEHENECACYYTVLLSWM